jgi:iron-sulfur cluster assembly protein
MENEYQVFISESAAGQIKDQFKKRGTPDAYLRLGIKGGGCSGFSYVLQYEDSAPREKDLLFTVHDIKVIVDKKSIIYLTGTILDWEKTFIYSGFKFVNPQEKNKCGCGNSFNI